MGACGIEIAGDLGRSIDQQGFGLRGKITRSGFQRHLA